MATGIVNYYTEAQLKAYVAKHEKTLAAALQAMTAERDDALYAGRLIVQRCDRLVAERDALKADAERYRWLFGARTAEQCASEDVGLKPPLTQDFVLADLSGFYSHKELVDDMIDTAMKGKS